MSRAGDPAAVVNLLPLCSVAGRAQAFLCLLGASHAVAGKETLSREGRAGGSASSTSSMSHEFLLPGRVCSEGTRQELPGRG